MTPETMFLSDLGPIEAATYSTWNSNDVEVAMDGGKPTAKSKAIQVKLGRPKSILIALATPNGCTDQQSAILRLCGLKDKAVYWEGTCPASRFAQLRADLELFGASFKRTNRAAPASRATVPTEADLYEGMV